MAIVSAIIIYLTFGLGLTIATYAAIEDAKTHLLRNIYTGPLAAVAVAGFAADAAIDRTGLPLIDLAIGVAIFAGPWLLSFLVSPASIGFGDVKYSAGLGLYLGWIGPVTAFRGVFLASLIGAAVALGAMVRRRRGDPLPFGPALLAGAVLAVAIAALG